MWKDLDASHKCHGRAWWGVSYSEFGPEKLSGQILYVLLHESWQIHWASEVTRT